MQQIKNIRLLIAASSILGISLLHYLTPLHLPMLHDVFQRLYYLPIILSVLWFGLRGGLTASLVVSIMYVPHILFQWGIHPSLELEKYLEILLYNVVGGVTGLLSQREETRREELERTAKGLEESYRKLHEQADLLIKTEEQLRRSERLSALGELSATLAHEIRNPLGSIKGTTEILKDSFAPGEKKYEFLEILLKEADRLNRVVENFLGLASPVRVEQNRCDIMLELRELVEFTTAEALSMGVKVRLEPAEIPPIKGDTEKLRQVFLNLLMNALQATGNGGEVVISAVGPLHTSENQPVIELSFADNGQGIDQEMLEQIFQPFFTTKKRGTGLGLAITQKIVESHGGTIRVTSTKGKGTTFTVTLPA
ncbi:two-component system sensor histidine kinase NtrB [Geotalea toluenoxydans]|uniref:two-component system sensor histidine kinase NtrB n=1 Tax=Geotalea toluenoxydans TaxID=421624 RepID=UPI0006D20C33|nr:ATP-binding protein [Geotalea toluenoxydans]